jgi:energy-coupling factor transporter ATP-binding protein EcfA2
MLRTECERRRVTSGPFGAIDLRPRRRRRPWQRSGPRMALGIKGISGRPVWLSFAQLGKHVLILGATGSGKSNTLVWMASRAIRAGHGAVLLDMKGDPELRERLAVEAGLNGRPFYVWQIEAGGQRYNPLKAGDTTAKRDRLTASQMFSEDYYRGLFSTHSKIVLGALEAAGRETTIAALREFWDPQDLKGLTRAIDDEDARDALANECERLTRQQAEHVVSLRARLAEVADTTAGESLRAGTSEADEIDLRRALERRAIVVFSVNSDVYPGAAATIGNLVLQDLVGVVGGLRQARIKAQSVLAVDEFGALSGDQLGRLFSTARDVGLPTLLAGQDLAQLRRVSPHFEAEVKANVSALIAHRQSEPDSAEQIARMCGTEEVVAQTRQVDHRRWPGSNGQTGHETGVGSQHHERQFRVQPDAIKDLDTGEAVVRLWNPGSVQIARMYRCETSDEATALATVTRRGKHPEGLSVQEIIRVGTGCRERLAVTAGEAR